MGGEGDCWYLLEAIYAADHPTMQRTVPHPNNDRSCPKCHQGGSEKPWSEGPGFGHAAYFLAEL